MVFSTHAIQLSGGLRTVTTSSAGSTHVTGNAAFIQSTSDNWGFTSEIVSGSVRHSDAASATITVSATNVANIGEGDTIQLISTDAQTVTLTLQGQAGSTTSAETSGATLTAKTLAAGSYANASLHATAQADEIMRAINHQTKFTATKSSNVITVKQATAGADGNTTITITEIGATGLSKTNFTSGTDAPGTTLRKIDFNFNPDSAKFIRKVFNTNPILTNGDLTDSSNTENYWLAHSFERSLNDTLNSSSAGAVHGVMLKLGEISSQFDANFSNFKFSAQSANTGWFISQDLRASGANFNPESTTYIKKLFKIHARDGGEWENGNIKISIKDIKASNNQDVDSYGSFTVQVRRAYDADHAVQVIEEYVNCNLNTNSPNYISRKIGDRFTQWDDTTRRFREYGEYPNVSRFVRVEVSTAVENGGVEPASLPFGFHGPRRPKAFHVRAGNTGGAAFFSTAAGAAGTTFATSSNIISQEVVQDNATAGVGNGPLNVGLDTITASFIYPRVALRVSSSDAFLSTENSAYFGYDSRKAGSDLYDPSNNDVLRMLPGQASSAASTELSIAFTLDDVKVTGAGAATWVSGSRAANLSATAVSGAYTQILDDGFDKFTAPMVGGHDGWDVVELDPMANRNFGASAKASYEFNTVRRAIETCADPELVDFNLMVAPGITNDSLTDLMVNTCEERADALAIVDVKNVYRGPQEGTSFASFNSRVGVLKTIVSDFKARKKNSSYGCTYYPWAQIRDSLNNATLWVPPSVVALGTFASSDRIGELWFAPAGFNRGGLSQGSSGLNVVGISEKLTSDQRDKLYEVNINPIASFPNEGIVIFGQKTLDATTSALNRINVRRLLIFLKKEISRLANQVLFDNNVPATWGRFQALVRPVLESVKIRFGLADYKLLLDETTTTPDLIDRNIMYAKIFLKPARAIEFIALDFVITRTGAAFED